MSDREPADGPDAVVWAALLGRWLQHVQALRSDPGSDPRVVASSAPWLDIQAITFALSDLDGLSPSEIAHARAQASWRVRERSKELGAIWSREPMPAGLVDAMHAVEVALERSQFAGVVELVWDGDVWLEVPMVELDAPQGTVGIAHPGTLLAPGTPLAWWAQSDPPTWLEAFPIDQCQRTHPGVPHQVYRQLSDEGRYESDHVQSVLDEPVPGMPLIVPVSEEGVPAGHFLMDAKDWAQRQRDAGVPG